MTSKMQPLAMRSGSDSGSTTAVPNNDFTQKRTDVRNAMMNQATSNPAAGVNYDKMHKTLIAASNEVEVPMTAVSRSALEIICYAVETDFMLGAFPETNSSRIAVGKWSVEAFRRLFYHVPEELRTHPMFLPARAHSVSSLNAVFTLHTGATAILVSAIRKFLDGATQYEDARLLSAATQLKNENASADKIANVLATSATVRAYISAQTNDLRATLFAIKRKIERMDPLDLPTVKETQLYQKHQSWLNSTVEVSDPLPQDNAVPYMLLLVEVVELVWSTRQSSTFDLFEGVHAFFSVIGCAMKSASNKAAYQTLALTPDILAFGFDIGNAVKTYVSDVARHALTPSGRTDVKLQGATQRGVRRTQRLAAIFGTCPSRFNIMKMPMDDKMQFLIGLHNQEKEITMIEDKLQFSKKGAEGLSDAESMMWLLVLGREEIHEMSIGRNDLCTPALFGTLTGSDCSAFGGLKARLWSHHTAFPAWTPQLGVDNGPSAAFMFVKVPDPYVKKSLAAASKALTLNLSALNKLQNANLLLQGPTAAPTISILGDLGSPVSGAGLQTSGLLSPPGSTSTVNTTREDLNKMSLAQGKGTRLLPVRPIPAGTQVVIHADGSPTLLLDSPAQSEEVVPQLINIAQIVAYVEEHENDDVPDLEPHENLATLDIGDSSSGNQSEVDVESDEN